MAKKTYYFFYLELALANSDNNHIFSSINISHLPLNKLVEIFNINLVKDPQILQGYFLTKSRYQKNKKYIRENIGHIDLSIFEYALRVYVSYSLENVEKQYKESLS